MQNSVRKIVAIVRENFVNGVRDDFIDTDKVCRIYRTRYPNENISQEVVISAIHENGTELNRRFYFVASDCIDTVRNIVDDILKVSPIAYFSVMYKHNAERFSRLNIFSPDVLKKILQDCGGTYNCYAEFCTSNKVICLDDEIAKIFSRANRPISLEELLVKLSYVPVEKILEILSNTKKYLPTLQNKYVPFAKVKFNSTEIDTAKRMLLTNLKKKNEAQLDECNLTLNFSNNPEIPEKVLRKVIFEKFFDDSFILQGNKILAKNGASQKKLSSVLWRSFIEFVATQIELPLEKLYDTAKNFGICKYDALSIASEKMIRVTKNLFIRDSLIQFDVAGVDDALKPFVQKKIIPLRAVTSFTGFPPVEGYLWNLFLLESFLRRCSQKYSYCSYSANSSNIGAIYPKSLKLTNYLDVQSAAIVQNKIRLEGATVEKFLIEQGYTKRCAITTTARILQRVPKFSKGY